MLRYGLLTHALIYKAARGEDDCLDDLVRARLLEPHERDALAPLPCKAECVWVWLGLFFNRALFDVGAAPGQIACSAVPCAPLAGTIAARIAEGRRAITRALACVHMQQPFPYVHLLAVITDLTLFSNALYTGAHLGVHLGACQGDGEGDDGDDKRCATGSSYLGTEAPDDLALVIVIAAARVVVCALVFSGLLSIQVMLENPMGADPTDMPGLAYQQKLCDQLSAYNRAAACVDPAGGWWRGVVAAAPPSSVSGGAGRKVDVEVHDEVVTTGYRCGLAQDAKDAGDL